MDHPWPSSSLCVSALIGHREVEIPLSSGPGWLTLGASAWPGHLEVLGAAWQQGSELGTWGLAPVVGLEGGLL